MILYGSNTIVSIKGGLGNQMFQYAAGRYLSHLNRSRFDLDITAYNHNISRKFELNNFNIKGEYIRTSFLSNLIYKAKIITGVYKNYEETFPVNIDLFQNIKKNTILTGYWQSEKYFTEIKDSIRKDFTFKKVKDLAKLQVSDQIIQSNSVAVHVRRGDYISNELFKSVYAGCDDKYYQNSIKYIAGKIESPVYYIFSDDMEWAKYNIKSALPIIYIDSSIHSELRINSSIIDLYLMSLCKHNIIANSSFSWWGAWLNQNPGKIVVAPKKWFNDDTIDTSDLLPETWIKI